jgi:hypothetical protein
LAESYDRRAAPRFPVTAGTECQFAASLVAELGSVRIENISMNGIGLHLQHRVAVGDILAIGIRNPAKSFDRVHLVHVTHVTARSGGGFLVGGTLDPPLTYTELTSLVM